jgi:hypothetical protein
MAVKSAETGAVETAAPKPTGTVIGLTRAGETDTGRVRRLLVVATIGTTRMEEIGDIGNPRPTILPAVVGRIRLVLMDLGLVATGVEARAHIVVARLSQRLTWIYRGDMAPRSRMFSFYCFRRSTETSSLGFRVPFSNEV